MITRILTPALALLALLAANPAAAQLDPGAKVIVQYDRIAGEIYVEEGQDTCVYVEHWFLFEDYQYPSERNGASFTVTPTADPYGSVERFLAAQRSAHSRGTYVEVSSVEHRDGCK